MTRLDALRTVGRRSIMGLLVAAVVVVAGCGGGDEAGPEPRLGSAESKADRQEERIADLERRLRERRAEKADAPRAGSSGSILDKGAGTSFDRLAGELGGQVGMNVGRVGATDSESLGPLRTGKAWSTAKLAIAARVLSDAGGPRALSSPQRAQMRQALTASDNGAAAQLFDGLKQKHGGLEGASQAITQPLRDAGDTATEISTQGRGGFSTYGQTDWSLESQQRFTAKLAGACVPDAASARELLSLMSQVVPGQRWGLGSAGVPGRFKGGWGPGAGGGYLVRQTGVLEFDGGKHPVVVTVAALPADGQFASGQRMLTRMSQWVVEHVDSSAATPTGC